MVRSRARIVTVAIFVLVLRASASSSVPDDPRFESSDPAKRPLSVPLSEIEGRINSDPSADGIRLSIATKDRILRVDLVSVPGDTSVAAVVRVIWMIGRLANAEYDEMRFVDGGKDIFVIDGGDIRDIGRQFVWGEEGKGQNPIHLIRLFVDALRTPDKLRVAPPFPGSLLGDTTLAAKVLNDRFHREWTLKTASIQ